MLPMEGSFQAAACWEAPHFGIEGNTIFLPFLWPLLNLHQVSCSAGDFTDPGHVPRLRAAALMKAEWKVEEMPPAGVCAQTDADAGSGLVPTASCKVH